ncbi:MAG: hypothetical protein II306_06335 [Clostridia bacterium]|nr:hypothetical protein [Clostridia bacterium]
MNLEQLGTYAPYIVIAIAFLSTYKIFVTPKDLEEKLKEYVLKETYNVAIGEIKNDILEIKSLQAKIYEKLISG